MPTFNAPATGGFLRGFTRTSLGLMKLRQAQQQFEQRQKLEKERIKIQQDLLKGRAAQFRLQMEDQQRKLAEAATLRQGRAEAGEAASALLDPTMQLDLQAQAELQSIVTRQQAAEVNFTNVHKLMEKRDDIERRRELAQSLDALLGDLPGPQQQFGRALLRAYSTGQLTDDNLFRVFDKLSGSSGPSSMLSLVFMAAGKGPRSAQARRALELLPDEQHNMTATHLAWLAQQGGEVGKQAQAALDALTKLRQTGVRSRKRVRTEEEAPSPFLQPQLTPPPGGGVQGLGRTGSRPRVKSFKRVK